MLLLILLLFILLMCFIFPYFRFFFCFLYFFLLYEVQECVMARGYHYLKLICVWKIDVDVGTCHGCHIHCMNVHVSINRSDARIYCNHAFWNGLPKESNFTTIFFNWNVCYFFFVLCCCSRSPVDLGKIISFGCS